MNPSYTIRKAYPGEAEYLTQLAIRSMRYWGFTLPQISLFKHEIDVKPRMLGDCFVVEDTTTGKPAGFWCRPMIETEDFCDDERVFVDPPHIGKGCGRRLWEAVKKACLEHGIYSFKLEASAGAVPFYLKMGGVKISERKSKYIEGYTIGIIHFDLRQN